MRSQPAKVDVGPETPHQAKKRRSLGLRRQRWVDDAQEGLGPRDSLGGSGDEEGVVAACRQRSPTGAL